MARRRRKRSGAALARQRRNRRTALLGPRSARARHRRRDRVPVRHGGPGPGRCRGGEQRAPRPVRARRRHPACGRARGLVPRRDRGAQRQHRAPACARRERGAASPGDRGGLDRHLGRRRDHRLAALVGADARHPRHRRGRHGRSEAVLGPDRPARPGAGERALPRRLCRRRRGPLCDRVPHPARRRRRRALDLDPRTGFLRRRRPRVRAIGAIIDVTERKLAEEALRDSEEMFRGLAEALPQIVWIMRASDLHQPALPRLPWRAGRRRARRALLEPASRRSRAGPRDARRQRRRRPAVRARRAGAPARRPYRWHRMSCVPLARDGEVRSASAPRPTSTTCASRPSRSSF